MDTLTQGQVMDMEINNKKRHPHLLQQQVGDIHMVDRLVEGMDMVILAEARGVLLLKQSRTAHALPQWHPRNK